MKKLLAMVFGFVMACTLFTGCGNNSTTSSESTTTKATTTTSAAESGESSEAEPSKTENKMEDTDKDGVLDDIESGANSIGDAVSSAVESLT